jgi:glutamate/tyrosine decarboxylase-like PLP-dependent enzyme
MEMIERIRALERVSRRLEPAPAERARVRGAVVDYAEAFLERLSGSKTYVAGPGRERELRGAAISETPAEIGGLLRLLGECVDTLGINPASGGHLGYIPGGGLYYSSLGDYLAAISNRFAGVRFANPGAVELESLLLDWLAGLVGYPAGAAGNLASGGSIANLVAIVTAREAHGLRARDYARAVVYLSEQTHHCIPKALRVAGLGECVQRCVALDDRYRMVPSDLERMIAEDRAAGLRPWLVIATAGTTDVGAIDPLAEIGRIAQAHGLWYHIDAAYGGFFLLVDDCRPKLAGLELSDSVVLDPHKGLFLPYGTGAVLVRDRQALHRAHYYQAAYMQDAAAAEPELVDSPAELSPELTKHFRALRLWLPLMLHGLEPFRACLAEKLLLARHFHAEARKLGFEVGPEPELSVATYRWLPKTGDANAFNAALLEEIHRDGRVFVSSTTLGGKFVLRAAVLAFRTHLDTIELLLRILREKVDRLERGPGR